MVFFFDRNISPRLIHTLGFQGISAVHHNDKFNQDTQDPEIIEYVAERGLVLVTWDLQLWREHRAVLRTFFPKMILLPNSVKDSGLGYQVDWFRQDWLRVIEKYQALPQPAIVKVDPQGRISVMDLND